MCIICDGASREDAVASLHRKVMAHGWALQGVEAESPERSWVYSIGLCERFDHPELVAVGPLTAVAPVINELGERIRDGTRFAAGDRVEVFGTTFEIGSVHVRHLRHGLCAGWHEYYSYYGDPTPTFSILQVVPPRVRCTCGKVHPVHRLADPRAEVVEVPPGSRRCRDLEARYRPRSARWMRARGE